MAPISMMHVYLRSFPTYQYQPSGQAGEWHGPDINDAVRMYYTVQMLLRLVGDGHVIASTSLAMCGQGHVRGHQSVLESCVHFGLQSQLQSIVLCLCSAM